MLLSIDITPEALEKYSQLPVFWVLISIGLFIFVFPVIFEIWKTGGPIKDYIGIPKDKFYNLFKSGSRRKANRHEIILASFNEHEFDYDNNYEELFNSKWFYNNKEGREEASIKIIGGDCIYIKGRLYDIPEHYYGCKIFKTILNKTKSDIIHIDITEGRFLPKMLEEIYNVSLTKRVIVLYNNKQNEIIEVARLLKSKLTNTNVEFRNYDRYNIIYKKLQ